MRVSLTAYKGADRDKSAKPKWPENKKARNPSILGF
jgi:hypothetical protein